MTLPTEVVFHLACTEVTATTVTCHEVGGSTPCLLLPTSAFPTMRAGCSYTVHGTSNRSHFFPGSVKQTA